MKQPKPLIQQVLDIFRVVLGGLAAVVVVSFLWTFIVLLSAQRGGVYATPDEGMRAMIARSYVNPDDSQVIYAGTNSFDGSDPHVQYVIACVWGGHRLDGTPTGTGGRHGYDQPGVFFLDTKKGWVQVSEGAFPTFVGYWMKIFGMAGPGSATPFVDWGSTPNKGCEF